MYSGLEDSLVVAVLLSLYYLFSMSNLRPHYRRRSRAILFPQPQLKPRVSHVSCHSLRSICCSLFHRKGFIPLSYTWQVLPRVVRVLGFCIFVTRRCHLCFDGLWSAMSFHVGLSLWISGSEPSFVRWNMQSRSRHLGEMINVYLRLSRWA